MARLEFLHCPAGPEVAITLSHRNLLSLLHKLDVEGSARTIRNNDSWIDGSQTELGRLDLVVTACEDAEIESERGWEVRGVRRSGGHDVVLMICRRKLEELTQKLGLQQDQLPVALHTDATGRSVDLFEESWKPVLYAEDDLFHYARRGSGPGPLSEETEAFVRERGGLS